MDADQKGDPAQRGLAVPCLVIFAVTYVLGSLVSFFVLYQEAPKESIVILLGWSLLVPASVFSMPLHFIVLYPLEFVCFGVLLIMGFVHFMKWLHFENRRKVNLAIVFVFVGYWVWWIIYAAVNFQYLFL